MKIVGTVLLLALATSVLARPSSEISSENPEEESSDLISSTIIEELNNISLDGVAREDYETISNWTFSVFSELQNNMSSGNSSELSQNWTLGDTLNFDNSTSVDAKCWFWWWFWPPYYYRSYYYAG